MTIHRISPAELAAKELPPSLNIEHTAGIILPLARFVVPDGAYLTLFKKLYRLLLGHGSIYSDFLNPMGCGCLRACGILTERAAMAS